MTRQAGFTLIEMLVALAIFALIAVASSSLLGGAIAGRGALARTDERLAGIEVARAIIKADLAQIALRATRDESGRRRPWRFLGRDPGLAGAAPALAFTRRGWSNPEAGEARSGLLYVEYVFADSELVRLAHHRPDTVAATPVTRRVLLSGVDEPHLRFLGGDGQWLTEWRVPAGGGVPPRAVELRFGLNGQGTIRQVFLAGGG